MNNKFAIGIPTINRYDLLKETLEKYLVDFPNTYIYVVDNGNQGITSSEDRLKIFNSHKNLGVSGSWNLLVDTSIFLAEYVLLLNDDIYLGKKEQEILDLIEQEKFDFYVSHGTWCSFLLPINTFVKVGPFDEQFFPAYFEDNDYHQRMKLQNMSYKVTEVLTPVVFRNSATVEKDPSLNKNFDENKLKYLVKWGGFPGEEKYKTPYNEQ